MANRLPPITLPRPAGLSYDGSDDTNEDSQEKTGHSPTDQPQLEVVKEIHELDDADQTCPKCGGDLNPINGLFEESEEVDVVERRYVLKKHKKRKYRCECHDHIETTLGSVKTIDGGRYSIEFGVDSAVQKYAVHIPLARQTKVAARQGLAACGETPVCAQAARRFALIVVFARRCDPSSPHSDDGDLEAAHPPGIPDEASLGEVKETRRRDTRVHLGGASTMRSRRLARQAHREFLRTLLAYISGEDSDLTVFDFTGSSSVLTVNAHGVFSGLQKASFVDDQHST